MKDKILTFSSISIIIGVIGFSSSIVTMFVDVNSTISIKWLIFCAVSFLSIAIIMGKIIYDFNYCEVRQSAFEIPFKYVSTEGIFLIRKNEIFMHNIIVGCYTRQDEIDRLAYLGVVQLIQDRMIQIRIIRDFELFNEIVDSADFLKRIMIRSVIPFNELTSYIQNGE